MHRILIVTLLLAGAPAARADYYIVVSEQNPVTRLSQTEVLHLFMGRSRAFPGGHAAVTYDIDAGTQREGFYRALSGMSQAQVNSYWARLMFSGRSLPPLRLQHEADMVQKIRNDPKAIGWLFSDPVQKGLRTVLVLRAAP